MADSNAKTKVSISGGVGFPSLLTLIFITLKLTKVIDWGWVWVLAPLWMSAILYFLLIVAVIFLAFWAAKKT